MTLFNRNNSICTAILDISENVGRKLVSRLPMRSKENISRLFQSLRRWKQATIVFFGGSWRSISSSSHSQTSTHSIINSAPAWLSTTTINSQQKKQYFRGTKKYSGWKTFRIVSLIYIARPQAVPINRKRYNWIHSYSQSPQKIRSLPTSGTQRWKSMRAIKPWSGHLRIRRTN